MNFCRLVLDSAARGPERIALKWPQRRISYGELAEEIGRHAALLAHCGVRAGDRVGLQVPKSPETIFLHLGCLALGAVALPLNDAYRPAEVAYCLADSGARLFVTNSELHRRCRQELGAGGPRVMTVDQKEDGALHYPSELDSLEAPPTEPFPSRPQDAALICYTSGTTGRPKGAVLTHRNLVENLEDLAQVWRMSHQDVVLNVLPLFHVHGLMVCLYLSLMVGAKVVLHPRFDPRATWRAIETDGITVFMAVPTIYQRLLDTWRELEPRPLTEGMRVFISGSAPLSEVLFEEFRRALGQPILERYGMTETIMIASNPYPPEKRKAGSVGYPLPRVRVSVRDQEGKEVTPGRVGEVCVQGGNVFREYWGQPDKTRQSYFGEWFRTGDLGYQDPEDGLRLYLVGRAKELVISGGYNVYPKEVELRLEHHPGVKEAAVVGLADRDLGERVTAAVVPAPGQTPAEEELIAFCRQALAPYKCPKRVHLVSELPRNSMGKVMKQQVARLCRQREADLA